MSITGLPGSSPRLSARRTFPFILLPVALLLAGVVLLRPSVFGGSSHTAGAAAPPSAGAASSPASVSSNVAPPPPTAATFEDQGFPVTVAAGLLPNWNPEAAALEALRLIQLTENRIGKKLAPAAVVSMQVVEGRSVPYSYGNGALGEHPIVWIVAANGTFQATFGPPGGNLATAPNGYYLFDDTGRMIGHGFPIPG